VFVAAKTTSSEDSKVAANDSKSQPSVGDKDVSAIEKRRMELMRSMAQLRLEAEVNQLEAMFRNASADWTPYLVAEASVLCDSLASVQELCRCSKFIIIIPLVGTTLNLTPFFVK
jgi:hypothetical protein